MKDVESVPIHSVHFAGMIVWPIMVLGIIYMEAVHLMRLPGWVMDIIVGSAILHIASAALLQWPRLWSRKTTDPARHD